MNNIRKLVDDTPYLEQYLKDNWLRQARKHRVFDELGEPLPKVTKEVETFVRFQQRMIKVERAFTFLGLEEESPGLATPSSVRDAIDETRTSHQNRYFRLVTKSEALR